jgi:DNA-binding CsgD family transcriptional regulator
MNNNRNSQPTSNEPVPEKILRAAIAKCKLLEQTVGSSVYLIDFMEKRLLYVSRNDVLFTDKNPKEQVNFVFSLVQQRVDPSDALTLVNIFNAIKKYLQMPDCNFQEIDSFSCTYRLLLGKRHLMVHQRTIPVVQGNPRLAICVISPSVAELAGNLEVYYCGNKEYAEYSLLGQYWKKRQPITKLTVSECKIIALAKFGLNTHDIADILCLSDGRIRNTLNQLYDKLNVKSILQALIHLSNYPQLLL